MEQEVTPNGKLRPPGTKQFTPMQPRKDLTDNQEKFARSYVATGNIQESYRRAGYNINSKNVTKNAREIYENPKVQLRIAQLKEEAAKKYELTTDEITHKLLKAYDAAMGESQYSAAIRAAELLGKHLGMFIERSEHHHIIEGIFSGNSAPQVETDLKNLIRIAYTTDDLTGEQVEVFADADSKLIEYTDVEDGNTTGPNPTD